MSKRADLENELTRLRAAKVPTIESFAKARRERIASIEIEIAAMPADASPVDPKLENVLRRAAGGDKFGR